MVISGTAKLDYKMQYLVIRTAEQVQRIHLSEIAVVVIESTAVSLTAYLLCEMANRKINIIFCDQKRNPHGVYLPLYGSHNTSQKVRSQFNWTAEAKADIWQAVVKRKILGQASVLKHVDHPKEELMLKSYIQQVEPGDVTNREGHAAKVYFNALFGMDFTRTDKDNTINAELNYGYAILLSSISREIASCGYITQIGINHNNMFNEFNLACDLMEPFRPFVDMTVLRMEHKHFSKEQKIQLIDFLNKQVLINGKEQFLQNAIKEYTKSILDAIDIGSSSIIKFPEYELSIYESNRVL